MNSVSVEKQRANNDAISYQDLPQIQNALMAGSGPMTQKGWNISVERPERDDNSKRKIRKNSKSEIFRNRLHDENADSMVTRDNESPVTVPELLTGRVPSRTTLNQSQDDHNQLLDTTIPAQERVIPVADLHPINRLADVLASMQNRPTAQQLTICPVNSSTLTLDNKSEKFVLFEDLFNTMIEMQPEISEQMKINHSHSLLRK